jgi:superfamily II DNA or RNA helicase/HKD family nuclease/diadenosine tetraphosphate (Ap4A) HIT family hydrolase
MDKPNTSCPFCNPAVDRIFYMDSVVIGLWDGYPVSPGHALIVPRRHVASWFEATADEKYAVIDALERAKREIEKTHAPQGYNIGVNVGSPAGQTIFHLHVHLIPRYHGDMPDPRGGVRYVIPQKANYLSKIEDSERLPPLVDALLHTGDPFKPFAQVLKQHLATSKRADIAVAFVMKSGVDVLQSAVKEALSRGVRVRLLTGDYLDATDPIALVQLLDLEAQPGDIELRVYETARNRNLETGLPTSFHPKAYIFEQEHGSGTAFIGSSNLSKSALTEGVEWNYRVVSSRDGQGFQEACAAFDVLFQHPATAPLTEQWIEAYKQRRKMALKPIIDVAAAVPTPEVVDVPTPHSIQLEALQALQRARAEGATAGLVVLATGLGKTWLSAFDSVGFGRVLFVAHREEILGQAMETFRRIRPRDYLGKYDGNSKHANADVLFASIQTLSRQAHLDRFAKNYFDYIVMDEFHHASAATYRRLLGHFEPRFLLGLTATPERSDGADLLDLCDGNLVYRCDLAEGIRRGLLCPFDYFGVPDEVDYRNIPWRSSRFDEEALTTAVATTSRAENALDQLEQRGGRKTLAFCVSQRHADFMTEFFRRKGKRVAAVHSGSSSAPRTLSLERLQAGELDIVCAVDMFNEGVDMPDLDTVMMLRPTESKILWLQQFGRGLRRADPEKRLKVIDYIGNHRTFLLKPQTLFNLPAGDQNVQNLLEKLQAGTEDLPPGCSVIYDLRSIEILKGLLRVGRSASEALKTYVQDFIEVHGVRPTALEAHRDGYSPRSVRQNYGSWHGFLTSTGSLSADEQQASQASVDFLDTLETTRMTRSFKMATLLVMLNEDMFPGSIDVDALVAGVQRLAQHQPRIGADFGIDMNDHAAVRRSLEQNPINAWTVGADTGGQRYFTYAAGVFSSADSVGSAQRESFQALVRELVEWRLAEYFDRPAPPKDGTYLVKVNQSNGNPILMPLNREQNTLVPEGWTPFIANGRRYLGNFVKVALNVAKKEDGAERNELPAILRTWFGHDAGAPGTRHFVELSLNDGQWTMSPSGTGIQTPVLWKSYSREQIPGLFGLEFNPPIWQQGFVRRDEKTFLLVTLDKSAAAEEHQYEDRFLSPTTFQWQSQNQTARDSKAGRSIEDHKALGIDVHLFVRQRSKTREGKAMPFVYCGLTDFDSWKGDNPITVNWTLREPVPERLKSEMRVP